MKCRMAAPVLGSSVLLFISATIFGVLSASAQPTGESFQSGVDRRVNDNAGATTTSHFTQSEPSLVAFGNTVVVGFNDSGSNAGGTNKFTGFAYSTDGGASFTDGGALTTNPGGDAGDPVLARNQTTGRIFFSTLGFNVGTVQVFRSDTNGVSWLTPVNGTPGGSAENKEWLTVDNFPGAGNGNVYLGSRSFGGSPGIYSFRSTDGGATFGPKGGVLLANGIEGVFVAVGPDHSVYAFWFDGTFLRVRKSVNQGLTFGASFVVASGLTGGNNGDLGLTGIRQGTMAAAPFRTNSFPHAAANPINGHLYVTFNDNPAGVDKADVFMVMSTDGGVSWSARVRVNDDATITDQWQPTIAVKPTGDQLGVFYYSRQEDPMGNNLFKYYGRFAAISGGLVTFEMSAAISDVPSLPEFGRDSVVNSVYMGDYDMTVASGDNFHVVWADNRDDLPGGGTRKDPNVYYDRIFRGVPLAIDEPAEEPGLAWNPSLQIAPNPFNPATEILLELQHRDRVELSIIDPSGRQVRSLIHEVLEPGTHRQRWDGRDTAGHEVSSGTYFCRLTSSGSTVVRKLTLIR